MPSSIKFKVVFTIVQRRLLDLNEIELTCCHRQQAIRAQSSQTKKEILRIKYFLYRGRRIYQYKVRRHF